MNVILRQVHTVLGRLTLIGTTIAVIGFALAPVAEAARDIRARYGLFELAVTIASIEAYLEDGTVRPDLAAYINRLTPEQLEYVEQALQSSIETEQVAIANFLYTRQGETILRRLGDVVRTQSNSGFFALRAALILAAGEEGGLTPLGFLKNFPTDSLVVDIDRGLGVFREFQRLVGDTNSAVSRISALSERSAAGSPPVADPNEPRRSGEYQWEKMTFEMLTRQRRRRFKVDLYLPDRANAPVIVISHGLGSNRSSFRYLAEHLASRGYAVAAPDHPGSDASYIEDLLNGTASQVAESGEFADRPLDISALLDELGRKIAAGDLPSLDLETVGVVGQSFGGYTALALAGAEINFSQLAAECTDEQVRDTLNLSLLLQCRALELRSDEAQEMQSLADDRVKAAIAINPIGSSIFGQSGMAQITIPTMVVSGSNDFVAPTLFEQLIPFDWIEAEDKYLVLQQNGTHFSTIGDSVSGGGSVPLPPEILGPEPGLAQEYTEALSLAFFEAHLRNQPDYSTYLSSAYAEALSRDPIPLRLVESLDGVQLSQLANQILTTSNSAEPN
ncbi:MAG: alpha/beta hydrolase [Elainellaceae cyanobacterium]